MFLDNFPIDDHETQRLLTMSIYEEQAYAKGFNSVAGIDEAGRGPLAGPVVAAVCILPRGLLIPRLNDSKKLSPKMRQQLFQYLISHPDIRSGVGVIEPEVIDRVNIYQATILAMWQAVDRLEQLPDCLLVDGMHLEHSSLSAIKIIKGDQLSVSIAAASVIAKETRDRLMHGYHQQWPQYGFDQHKGYGTPQHLAALYEHGPCQIHRLSFDPIKSS
jgi:ribonuclease HII